MSFRHNTYYNLQANNNFHLQQPDTSKGFTNLFSDSYLDQLLLASTNTTAANFNNSSDSSPTSSSSVSEAGCSPPRTFLSDGIIDGLLPFSSMSGLDTLRRDKNIIAQPIITKESYQQQMQEDFITKTAIAQQKCSSSSNINSKNKYGITTNKKKKNKIVGQSTMSIKLVSSQKTLRPSRKIECFNCKVKKTPLWRRTPDRLHSLCNACGLYYKQYNSHRPLHVRNKTIRAQHPQYAVNEHIVPMTINMNNNKQQPSPSSTSSSSIEAASGSHSDDNSNSDQECTNCHQTQTPLWRKNNRGEPLCNACGLYAKLHHRDRPVEMRKSTIQRRRRDWATNDNDTTIYVQEEVEDEGVEREEVEEEEEYVDVDEERSRRRNISFTAETSLPNHIDSRFQSLLVSMNREQMRSFLNMMERRCDFLKAILEPGSS